MTLACEPSSLVSTIDNLITERQRHVTALADVECKLADIKRILDGNGGLPMKVSVQVCDGAWSIKPGADLGPGGTTVAAAPKKNRRRNRGTHTVT